MVDAWFELRSQDVAKQAWESLKLPTSEFESESTMALRYARVQRVVRGEMPPEVKRACASLRAWLQAHRPVNLISRLGNAGTLSVSDSKLLRAANKCVETGHGGIVFFDTNKDQVQREEGFTNYYNDGTETGKRLSNSEGTDADKHAHHLAQATSTMVIKTAKMNVFIESVPDFEGTHSWVHFYFFSVPVLRLVLADFHSTFLTSFLVVVVLHAWVTSTMSSFFSNVLHVGSTVTRSKSAHVLFDQMGVNPEYEVQISHGTSSFGFHIDNTALEGHALSLASGVVSWPSFSLTSRRHRS